MAIRNNPIPKELLCSPSPLINDLAAYISQSSLEYIPQYSLQASITILSHLYGRQYIGSTGLSTGMQSLIVGQSGIGKNYIKKTAQKFKLLNANTLSGATSDSGLFTALVRNPNLMIVSDEMGDKFNSKNGNNKLFWALIKDVYNADCLDDQGFSGRVNGLIVEEKEKYEVQYPCLTMLGMTTPDQIISGLNETDIKGGVLNRFTIVNAFIDELKDTNCEVTSDPSSRLCQLIMSSGSNLENHSQSFFNKTYSKSPRLNKIAHHKNDLIMLAKKRRQLLGERNSSYTVRTIEKVMIHSMITAISMGLNEIPSSVVEWCLNYELYWDYNIRSISEAAGQGDQSKEVEKITDFIKFAGESGVERYQINVFCRKSTNYYIDESRRNNLLISLINDKLIEETLGPKSVKNGKQKTLYFYIGDKRK